MQRLTRIVLRRLGGALALSAAAGCTLPRSGPTAGEILSAGEVPELGMNVVPVTPAVAAIARSSERLGFDPEFLGAAALSPDLIRAGDTVSVTVWENVEAGILAGSGQRVAELDGLQVDQKGEIFVPYAGRIRAAGRTPEQLRQAVTEALAPQTPDPQVEVRRTAGEGATVSVLGGVGAPGVYPITVPTQRLSAMLAAAGGVALVPDVAQVQVQRGGRTGRIWLQDLYDDPRLDIALRAGDQVIVEEDRRSFTALGATEGQAQVDFDERDMTALEGIAAAGGLDDRSADPTGVFIFRVEPAETAARVLGRSDLVGPQRMAYLIDLTEPMGLFAAREFVIRDEDTIYITTAPFASWSRVLGVATTALALTGSAAALDNRF